MYAGYDFYAGEYHGNKVSEADFIRLSVQAGTIIDKMTFERAAQAAAGGCERLARSVKLAECAAIDAIYQEEQRAGIASETVGKLTVTYNNNSSSGAVARAIRLYLSGTGLLYAGV